MSEPNIIKTLIITDEKIIDENTIYGLADDGRIYYRLKYEENYWYFYSSVNVMKNLYKEFYHLLPFLEK